MLQGRGASQSNLAVILKFNSIPYIFLLSPLPSLLCPGASEVLRWTDSSYSKFQLAMYNAVYAYLGSSSTIYLRLLRFINVLSVRATFLISANIPEPKIGTYKPTPRKVI